MYLKALEIQGFKSFPDKTRLSFEKNITAIVGPNGSGKSNISDAILWVMGEQRSRALRGNRMEDVIFGGTQKRSALGYAQVSLILDNSARLFELDSDEITLTRRYYRSGESEYYINRESVRLKDIHSLLMDTGLGRDGYSIIGQGRISEIVSTRSTDRREVFEEAAGISRFRFRKEEAESRLARTEENLQRVNDKIEELHMQVEPLQKQAETAKKYLVLRDELRVCEVSLWMATLEKLRGQSESVRQEFEQATASLEKAKNDLAALYASSGSITERMHQKDVEAEQARERLSRAEAEASGCAARAAVLRTSLQNCEDSKTKLLHDIDERENRERELCAGIAEQQERLRQIGDAIRELDKELTADANVISGCRMKLDSRQRNAEQLSERSRELEIGARTMDERINMLSAMEKSLEGYSNAVRAVMREAEHGTLRGVHAPVANLLRADDECALAIETALGAAAQNIVVDTQNDGRAAIEFLKRRDAGRATLLPIDTIRGTKMHDAPESDPGFVGVASELVRYDAKYEQIVQNLLGRTVVAETLADAVRMSKKSAAKLRIVTLDGQLINAGGSMTGGSTDKRTGILSRANELSRLRAEREQLREAEKKCAAETERANAELKGIRYQLDVALEEQNERKTRRSSLEAEAGAIERSAAQLNGVLDALSGDSDRGRAALELADRQIADFRERLNEQAEEQKRLDARTEDVRAEIAEISRRHMELEAKRTRAEKEAQSRSNEVLELERSAARIEQRKLAAEMEESQLLDKLWDSYELSHSAAEEIRRPVENAAKLKGTVAELRKSINALGTPNIGAIDEYERVRTRYEFLTSQRDDVDKAKKELLGIIGDITTEMQGVFVEKFRQIDECFRETFLELFGGGRASLVLEDENNVLDCGIDIRVQPPGKALSTISLLSGGEMAFVAIALYFAILKVRPTPFCVMDEIEAALDESNVVRYAEYMRRISDKTQFLVITHRRGTMEMADMLYGVTMQEKGVSTVIELDLESAQKTIEE